MEHILWYDKPAAFFEEAMPLGNGRLGAMHYADPLKEKLSLNEDTLWSGFPQDKSATDPYQGVCQARKLLKEGKIREAEETLWKKSLGKWSEAYQPAGSLHIDLLDVSDYSDYRRMLDLNDAVSQSCCTIDGYQYSREVFCSEPDQVLVYHFRTDAPHARALVYCDSPHPYRAEAGEQLFVMRSIAPVYSAPAYYTCDDPIRYDTFENNRALSYVAGVKIIPCGGSCMPQEKGILIDSTEFYLLLDVETNFAGFNVQPAESTVDPLAVCTSRLSSAADFPFDTLKKRHLDDYHSLYQRVSFQLDGIARTDLPTDRRLEAYSPDSVDVGLQALMFLYIRYLAIASSREHTQATNLQAIWNEKMRAPWSSNYTVNINTQMNYWPMERFNLPECHLPLMDLLSHLSQTGKITAQKNYHCGGWCSHHNVDLWAQSDPVGGENDGRHSVGFGFWNMSGCWMACDIWQHYLYTNDMQFLRENWEIMKGAAQFLLDWLTEDDNGQLITPIATSPENVYLLDGHPDDIFHISQGCAMDYGIAWELFESCIQAADALQCDQIFSDRLKAALARLKPYMIGRDGEILEWNKQVEPRDIHHRHISPVFGLYPGHSITEQTPEWRNGAITLLNMRGMEATGWALSWRMCCWARLGDGDRAADFINMMLRLIRDPTIHRASNGGVYPNLFTAHPPFQIDANFGYAAGILEMLIQEKNGKIIPLPALPNVWKKGGSIRGLKASGNRVVNISWKNGKITEFTVTPAQ